ADDRPRREGLRRDLARRYEADYEITGAASGADALDRLAGIAAAGGEVALLIADEHLAGMPAAGFLSRAHELHRSARRILLIDRGNWSATHPAVAAMAVGQIDYHLYAPWDPLERILYPAISQFLSDWDSLREPSHAVFRIVAPAYSPRAHELRGDLSRIGVPYSVLDSSSAEGQQVLREHQLEGTQVPVVIGRSAALVD